MSHASGLRTELCQAFFTWNFEQFELDEGLCELRRNGEAIKIPPKALGLLVYLAKRPHRTVPNQELLDALWPGVSVTAGALHQMIRTARKALGPTSARRLHTVRGFGYRWMNHHSSLSSQGRQLEQGFTLGNRRSGEPSEGGEHATPHPGPGGPRIGKLSLRG